MNSALNVNQKMVLSIEIFLAEFALKILLLFMHPLNFSPLENGCLVSGRLTFSECQFLAFLRLQLRRREFKKVSCLSPILFISQLRAELPELVKNNWAILAKSNKIGRVFKETFWQHCTSQTQFFLEYLYFVINRHAAQKSLWNR